MKNGVDATWSVIVCSLMTLAAAIYPANVAAEAASFTDLAALGSSTQTIEAPAAIPPAAPTASTNGLLVFSSQAEFETAFPDLPKEDFEGGTTPAGGTTVCTSPIDNTTTCAGLNIEDGLSISGPPTATMVVYGAGFGGWAPASTSLSTIFATDTHLIDFTGGNVNAVGFDLTGSAPTTATVNVFGASGLLDTLTVAITTITPTFRGIYSVEPITQILINAPSIRVIDNIQFGAIPSNLTFYTSQGVFTGAHPSLPVEDFEESGVTDTTYLNFTGPLDSASNIPGVFSPGDILPGLRINGLTSNAMITIGGNYEQGGKNIGNTTKVVAVNSITDGQRFDFINYDAYAVGMDLMRAWNAGNVTMAVYGPYGILLGTTTQTIQLSETFLGVYSNQPITRIEVLETTDVVLVDNIRFGGSPNGLTFFDSEASFLAAKSGLRVENFQESPVAPGGFKNLPPPINSTTNVAGAFSPGDILPGISFQIAHQSIGTQMVILGDGFFGAPTIVIGPNTFADNLEMTFARKNIRYFGTDAMVLAGGPADMLFSVYDDHDNFIGSALRNIGTTSVFLGFVSSKHVSRITITNPGGAGELVDNVRFGAFPWPTIMPAISGHAVP